MWLFKCLFGRRSCADFKPGDAVLIERASEFYKAIEERDPAIGSIGVVLVIDPQNRVMLISTDSGIRWWRPSSVRLADHISFRKLCSLAGFSESTLRMRLKRGWSMEEAVTTPVRRRP